LRSRDGPVVLLSVVLNWGDLASASAAVLGIGAIIGGIIRYGLIPYLRRELIEPAQETNRQITGTDTPEHEPGPTFREELAQLRHEITSVSGEVSTAAAELAAMAMMFDGHIEWSQEDHDAIRRERQEIVDRLWRELRRQREDGDCGAPRHGKHRDPGSAG
jgi:hypothetical protein